MRVRRLQTYLTEYNLLKRSSVESIRNLTLGIDALYFLRTSNDLKDTLSDISGCISPCIFHLIDKQCEHFKNLNINLIFVFDGITPKAHKLFSAHFHQNMDQGWFHYVNDEKKSYKNFSQVSNICNSDLTFLLFHYLKSKGYKCIYAPYLAIAQLSYFLEINMIDIVLGPPTIVLHNIQKVILNFVWKKNIFEWIDLYHLLKTWNINKEQFLDACLLAGTEYCLTFPYLNLSHFNYGNSQFNFGTSIEFIKQSPLISYLQHFPNEELRNNHIDGYCICKTLIKFPVVLLSNGEVDFFVPDKNWLNMKLRNDNIILNGVNKEINSSSNNNSIKDTNGKNKKISNVSTVNTNIEGSSKNGAHSSDVFLNDNNNIQKTYINAEKENNNNNLRYGNLNNSNNANDTVISDVNNFESNNTNKDEKLKEDETKNALTNNKINIHNTNINKNQSNGNTNNLQDLNNNECNAKKDEIKDLSKDYNNLADNNNTCKISSVSNSNYDEEENNYDNNLNNKDGNVSLNISKENNSDDTLNNKKDINSNKNGVYSLAPCDYIKVVGAKFPTCVYYLMSVGLLSKKLLCVLALGEWIDYSHPIIDSYEYRDSLIDLREYRCRILGLISIKLNPFFYKRKIKFFDYGYYINNILDKNNKCILLDIDLVDGFLWKINKDNVTEEIKRQNNNKIDLQFTLRWHLYSESKNISLIHKTKELNDENNLNDINEKSSENANSNKINSENSENKNNNDDNKIYSCDKKIKNYNAYYKNLLNANNQNFNSFLCIVYFMFLENLGIFTKNCGVTLFGLLLSEVKNKNIDNNILIIFELLKFGFLTTQPLLPPNGRSYPKNAYSSVMNNKNLATQDKKSVLLLSRIYSLYNANIDQSKTYDGLIDFDLCAFFSVVKIIKKTLRQLLQACVANVLISNMELIHILPDNLYSPYDTNISGFFVTHHLMGVLTKFFLLFNFDDIKKKKPSSHVSSDKVLNISEINHNSNVANINNSDTSEKKKNNFDSQNADAKQHEENNDLNKVDNKSKSLHNNNYNCSSDMQSGEEKANNDNLNENRNYKLDNEDVANVNEGLCINKKKNVNENHNSEDKKNSVNNDTKMTDDNEVNKNDNKNYSQNDIENSHLGNCYESKNNKSDSSANLNNQDANNGKENNKTNENRNEYDINDNKNCEQISSNCEENSQGVMLDNFNEFEKAVRKNFPSFLNPIIDLCNAINTWRDHLSLISQLEKHTNVYDLVSDLKAADKFLEKKIHYIGLHKTPIYIKMCTSHNG